jgi:hypothetical protein
MSVNRKSGKAITRRGISRQVPEGIAPQSVHAQRMRRLAGSN